MKETDKTTYSPPHLTMTEFEAADVVMISPGSDDNESLWRPTGNSLRLDIFDM
ncbi:MAG: hypothetical protein IJY20_06685 [Clostridia bacterium]|nr:hypothetical protein [Clostridia bacterium]